MIIAALVPGLAWTTVACNRHSVKFDRLQHFHVGKQVRRKNVIDFSKNRSMFKFEVLILDMQDYFHVGFDQFKNIKTKDQPNFFLRPRISEAEFACSHGH